MRDHAHDGITPRPVVIDGVEYPSVYAATKATGKHRSTIFRALGRQNKGRQAVTIRGVTYPSFNAAAKALNVAFNTVRTAAQDGRLETCGMRKNQHSTPLPPFVPAARLMNAAKRKHLDRLAAGGDRKAIAACAADDAARAERIRLCIEACETAPSIEHAARTVGVSSSVLRETVQPIRPELWTRVRGKVGTLKASTVRADSKRSAESELRAANAAFLAALRKHYPHHERPQVRT